MFDHSFPEEIDENYRIVFKSCVKSLLCNVHFTAWIYERCFGRVRGAHKKRGTRYEVSTYLLLHLVLSAIASVDCKGCQRVIGCMTDVDM